MGDDMTSGSRRRGWRALWWACAILCAALLIALLVPAQPPTRYGFIVREHPISVYNVGSGRWYYYMPDSRGRTSAQIAVAVRRELTPLGFTEDRTQRPWFRFVKGEKVVIVCNHDEVAKDTLGGSPYHETVTGVNVQKVPVVWVREPGRDLFGVAAFQVQKLVYRW